jgi:hypothetical protein
MRDINGSYGEQQILSIGDAATTASTTLEHGSSLKVVTSLAKRFVIQTPWPAIQPWLAEASMPRLSAKISSMQLTTLTKQ